MQAIDVDELFVFFVLQSRWVEGLGGEKRRGKEKGKLFFQRKSGGGGARRDKKKGRLYYII